MGKTGKIEQLRNNSTVCVFALICFLSRFLTDMPGLGKLIRSGGTDFDYQCVRVCMKEPAISEKYTCGYQRSNHTIRNAVNQKITPILFSLLIICICTHFLHLI